MKVNIITPVRPGGPYYSGEGLACVLNAKGITANWTHDLVGVLLSPVWQRADVVYSSDVPIAYRLWRKPLVLTVHGDYMVEKEFWRRFYPRAVRKADVVTTPSHFLKERLNLKDAMVVPNGIFPEKFAQVRHSEKDAINLVTVTSFSFEDKAKGVLEILKIIDAASKTLTKRVKYVVVGGGRYLEQVEQQARMYNVDVTFMGTQPNPGGFLKDSDIFVYYSYHDNVPMVIQEAMACRLPVVTNEFGAANELIEHEKDGYIGATHGAYLEYVLHLVSSTELRDGIGQNARRTVESKFDWAKIGDEYIEIYKDLVGSK